MEIRKDQEKKTNRVAGERRADDARRIADALKRRGRISLRVHGTSMQPWMRSKDIAVIRRISIERSEEHTSELQSQSNLVCRLLLEKKNWSTFTLNNHFASIVSSPLFISVAESTVIF